MSDSGNSGGGKAQAIRNEVDGDLLESADDAGVDVDGVIQDKMAKHSGYPADVVQRFVETDIRRQVESANAETIRGIHMGTRDRYAKNWPRRHSVIRSSGEHVEVSTWDGTLPGPEGEEVDIPAGGAIVEFQCDYDEEYDSYEAKGLGDVEQLDAADVAEKLSKIAVSPDQLTPSDEYEVVVVRGEVRYTDSQTIFEDGEPSHDGEVLVEDGRGELQPHFEVSLEQEGDTQLRGHIERQDRGRPFFAVPDLDTFLSDAYGEYDSADDQARFLHNCIKGRDVILIGNVNSFDKDRDDDGNLVKYVDIGVTGMVQANLADETPDVTSEDTGDGSDEAPDDADDDGDGDDGDDDVRAAEIDAVISDIELWADLVGEDIEDITTGDVVEKAKGIDAPESVVDHALRELQSDDDAGSDEPDEDESVEDESVEDEFAPLLESGMYQCPGEGCPGKGSSPMDLMHHVGDEHGADGADEARDWIKARM